MNEHLKRLLLQIPKGKVTTYKALAQKLHTSPRAIGRMLNANTELVAIPCHRVVKSTGELGGYKLGAKRKEELLKNEGVVIKNGVVSGDFFLT